ncbi:hypothetical protein SAMN04489760_11733 [Syntrophus gentianae]|uniref:SmpA / OmlA family protein n=1 Tax=Syntrophus gentianae TaxID=43775 RepID=A0A1H7YMN8_9BACT|nr:hypothetical protein [Syntrophus gentianae]SEM47502.1 hypothetical protein SAMN04489760_11733 [Syntrophus gentianae]
MPIEKKVLMEKIMIISAVFLCALLTANSGCALTPEQVIALKKAGVSDQTIQMMIKQEEAKDPYATMGTREVQDKNGNKLIINTTGYRVNSAVDDQEKENLNRAWEMLNNMDMDIKRNKKHGSSPGSSGPSK